MSGPTPLDEVLAIERLMSSYGIDRGKVTTGHRAPQQEPYVDGLLIFAGRRLRARYVQWSISAVRVGGYGIALDGEPIPASLEVMRECLDVEAGGDGSMAPMIGFTNLDALLRIDIYHRRVEGQAKLLSWERSTRDEWQALWRLTSWTMSTL